MGAILLIITLLLSASFASAQSPLAKSSFDEGTRLAKTGDFSMALKAYKNAAAATPDEGDFAAKIRYNLGVCYYRTGELKAAVRELNSAIRLSGGQYRAAFYARGMAESALEDWTAAERSFIRATELDPKDGEAWFDLAFVYLAKHDYDSAAAAFRKAIENRSVDAALGHNNLGVILAMKHEFDAAEKAFANAVAASSGRSEVARANLQFCRKLRTTGDLLAENRWTFAGRTKS